MLIKTLQEIKLIKKGGGIIGKILSDLAKLCLPGVSTWEIDQIAEEMIIKAGGKPSFKGYTSGKGDMPFPSTICAPRNFELVHAIAKKDAFLQEGDILSIDIGMEYPCKIPNPKSQIPNKHQIPNSNCGGYFTDASITIAIGEIPEKTRKLLRVTREALEVGIRAARPGNTVAGIGKAIEDYVNSEGKYGVVRDLVGHGVGHEVHEDPRIPNFYDKKLEYWVLKPGMVVAIEPMISMGDYRIKTAADGWTIEMADGSLCAHYEHTVVITKSGNEVVTRRPGERGEI